MEVQMLGMSWQLFLSPSRLVLWNSMERSC